MLTRSTTWGACTTHLHIHEDPDFNDEIVRELEGRRYDASRPLAASATPRAHL
jgi:hypothetical protein